MKSVILAFILVFIISTCISCSGVTPTQCENVVATFSTIANSLCIFVQNKTTSLNLSSVQADSLSTTMLMDQIAAIRSSIITETMKINRSSGWTNQVSQPLTIISTLDSLHLVLYDHLVQLHNGS